jgi:fibronectin-binding autotransporter adhesin
LSGLVRLNKNGSEKVTLSGNNTLDASITTTINAGTLQIGDGGTSGSISGSITDKGTLAFARSDNVSFGGVITGSGGVVQQGPGALVLTAVNDYAGNTEIQAGAALVLVDAGRLKPLSIVDNDGTFVTTGAQSHTFGSIVGTGTTWVSGNSELTATSIVQDTLHIGGTYAIDYSPIVSSLPAGNQPVPEPSLWLLLTTLSAALGGRLVLKRK